MKAYDYWLDELSLKEHATQINYLRYFHRYLEARGWTPEELYERQRVVLMDGDPRSNREIVLDLSRYIRDMVKEGYASGTAVKAGHAVVSFMAANGLDFPLRAGDLPRVVMSGSRVALVDEIRELLDLMGGDRNRHRNRALIMVSKDTGFRDGDVRRLDLAHVEGARVVENGGVYRVFKPYVTEKTGELAYPYWGPEAEEAVQLYLETRGDAAGPLFQTEQGTRMAHGSIGSMIIRKRNRLGWKKISHHSFRKFHRTALEARMPESWVKKLQGKATDPYVQPEHTGELTTSYVENYDALRVYGEKHELQRRLDELEDEQLKASGMRSEMQTMREDIALLRRALRQLEK